MDKHNYIIIVSGTPGTGKTVVSRKIEELLGCIHINSSELLHRLGLTRTDPTGRYTKIIDLATFPRAVKELVNIGKCSILETVYPRVWLENGLDEYVPLIILLRAHPLEIYRRLKNSRNWHEDKIIENCLAEAFNEIAEELLDYEHSVIEVDTTGKPPEAIENEIMRKLEEWDVGIFIDWLTVDPNLVDYITAWTSRLDLDKYRLGYRGSLH